MSMEYPMLNVKQKSRQMSDAFMGYNHNLRIGETEFYDMKNMTSDYYPVLSPRAKRGTYVSGADVNGIIAKDKLCYVDGTEFVIGEDRIEMGLSTDAADCPKELISMGAYVIIMPDKKYINTAKNGTEYEHGDIGSSYDIDADVTFTMCTLTGETYEDVGYGDRVPDSPYDGELWIDTSSKPHTLKKYSEANAMWVPIPTTYVKIKSATAVGLTDHFKQYDGVNISGITAEGAKELNGNHVLWGCGEDYIIVQGFLDEVATQTKDQGLISLVRDIPKMDFIVECNNRLWGCRYGLDNKGDMVNEIYASKLGDFKNWNCFMNLSTDSYTVSCGSDGPFTGATTHLGYPIFFKESWLHKVYGDYPANYRVQATTCRGVQKGSHRSLATVNETLFYKSVNGVCAYDGSLPVEVSSVLGEVKYSGAVACAHGNKYYIDMMTADGIAHLFVYDTAKGMWHKEDNIRVDDFCSFENELYAIDHETKNIITMLGSGTAGTENVQWMVETGMIGMSLPDMKYISRLLVRMSLAAGSSVRISIQHDSIGGWEQVCQMTMSTLRSFAVPIRPRRCDHFRIRIEGNGEGKVYSITKTIEQGSDVS